MNEQWTVGEIEISIIDDQAFLAVHEGMYLSRLDVRRLIVALAQAHDALLIAEPTGRGVLDMLREWEFSLPPEPRDD